MKRTTIKPVSLKEHPICPCLTQSPSCIDTAEPQASAALTSESPLGIVLTHNHFLHLSGALQVQTCHRAMAESHLESKERLEEAEDLYTTIRSIPFSKYAWPRKDFTRWHWGKSSVSKVLSK